MDGGLGLPVGVNDIVITICVHVCYYNINKDGSMRTPLFQLEDILKAFQKKKVLTIEQLLKAVGCSKMTAWRLLRKQGYLTSYNHNARYYTIDGIPQFDEYGLWSYRKICFSKWGALTDTMLALVHNSKAGLTAEQLQQRLEVKNLKPALSRLVDQKRLKREKIENHFVYFPLQAAAHKKQQKQRKQQSLLPRSKPDLPSVEHIISLLIEIIGHPKNRPRQWSRRLARQGIRITPKQIQVVVDHYQIDLKKGLFIS